jgi:hypothetical protein
MEEEGKAEYKSKMTELKQRLDQIRSQSFLDTRVFESEFSLYLKACESARNERTEGMRQQNSVVKTGMTVLIGASALTVYLFSEHVMFGLLVILGFGFLSCGFMFLLLNGEISIARAIGYCTELESYFKKYRWSTEHDEKLRLPAMPLWEEFRNGWNGDLFDNGHYGKRVIYAPFRLTIMFIDLLALAYVIHSASAMQPGFAVMLIISCTIWIVAVVMQMLLVHLIIGKVAQRLWGAYEGPPLRPVKREINWSPGTWVNILRLFFLFDILSTKETGTRSNP